MKILTGSARITTWTVALPGVSRETYGVNIVLLESFTLDSIPLSCSEGQENAILPKAFAWSTLPVKNAYYKKIYFIGNDKI